LHVHVSAPELTTLNDSAILQARVGPVWQAIEKVLFSYQPPSRRMSDYCRAGLDYGEKYRAFNTSPLSSPHKKTIEFRLHSATLSEDKALAFAAMCIRIVDKMVEAARNNNFHMETIPPLYVQDVPPKQIKTRKGGQFYLLRADGKWVIESPKLTTQIPTLQEAWTNYQKDLLLSNTHYLRAFHYPHFGNAMSKLCDLLELNGVFRGYAEDRYDRMLRKHGAADSLSGGESISEDEEDYYNEPDYDDRMQEAA
jgi:hypothetical protein